MTVRYHQRSLRTVPDYLCQARRIQCGKPVCQQIPGSALDDAIGKLLIDTVTPLTLEVALAVQTELESRCDETERLRSHEVERARYQSDQARRRFMHVDPGNRLVADTLEAEWNQALRALADARSAMRSSDRAIVQDLPTSSEPLLSLWQQTFLDCGTTRTRHNVSVNGWHDF